jgi:membrane protease YdiL (CAAX protease family)
VNRLRGWLVARPIVGFVVLVFAISYLVGGPVLLAGMKVIPPRAELLRGYVPRLLVVYGPCLAALTMARLLDRGGGAAGLLRRLVPSWTDGRTAGGILVTGAAAAVAAFSVAGVSPAELYPVVRAHAGLLLGHLALQVGVVAVGEEIGWRGWLLPQLIHRMSRLRATFATATIWALWHAPLLVTDPWAAVMFVLFVFGLSLVFTWLWAGARHGLFTVVIAHATVNAPLFFWEQVSTAAGGNDDRIRRAWYALQAMYTAAGVVLVLARWRWWMSPDVRDTELIPDPRVQGAPA